MNLPPFPLDGSGQDLSLTAVDPASVNMLSFQPLPPQTSSPWQHPVPEMPQVFTPPPMKALFSQMSGDSSGGGKSRKRAPKQTSGSAQSQCNRATPERFKSTRDFVALMLTFKTEAFTDRDFAERALLNLARKVSQQAEGESALEQWQRSVSTASPATSCVCISRPKDGRMTVSKSAASGTKKVFPQVFLCQVYRWPAIVFHNDILSTPECLHPAAVKPPVESSGPGDLICLNPFHYYLSAEALARFGKTSKVPGDTAKPRPRGSKSAKKEKKAVAEEPPVVISDLEFDPKGVDHFKLWKEKRTRRQDTLEARQFDLREMVKEVGLLTLKRGVERKAGPDLALRCKLVEQLRTIINGEYAGSLDSNSEADVNSESAKKSQRKPQQRRASKKKASKESNLDKRKEEAPQVSANEDSVALDDSSLLMEESLDADECAIQDLLEDIRGSFERQFDDEFEDLTGDDANSSAQSADNIPFAMDAAFPLPLDQQFQLPAQVQPEQQPHPQQQFHQGYSSFPTFVPQATMPSIVNSYSVQDGVPEFPHFDAINDNDFDQLFGGGQVSTSRDHVLPQQPYADHRTNHSQQQYFAQYDPTQQHTNYHNYPQ